MSEETLSAPEQLRIIADREEALGHGGAWLRDCADYVEKLVAREAKLIQELRSRAEFEARLTKENNALIERLDAAYEASGLSHWSSKPLEAHIVQMKALLDAYESASSCYTGESFEEVRVRIRGTVTK